MERKPDSTQASKATTSSYRLRSSSSQNGNCDNLICEGQPLPSRFTRNRPINRAISFSSTSSEISGEISPECMKETEEVHTASFIKSPKTEAKFPEGEQLIEDRAANSKSQDRNLIVMDGNVNISPTDNIDERENRQPGNICTSEPNLYDEISAFIERTSVPATQGYGKSMENSYQNADIHCGIKLKDSIKISKSELEDVLTKDCALSPVCRKPKGNRKAANCVFGVPSPEAPFSSSQESIHSQLSTKKPIDKSSVDFGVRSPNIDMKCPEGNISVSSQTSSSKKTNPPDGVVSPNFSQMDDGSECNSCEIFTSSQELSIGYPVKSHAANFGHSESLILESSPANLIQPVFSQIERKRHSDASGYPSPDKKKQKQETAGSDVDSLVTVTSTLHPDLCPSTSKKSSLSNEHTPLSESVRCTRDQALSSTDEMSSGSEKLDSSVKHWTPPGPLRDDTLGEQPPSNIMQEYQSPFTTCENGNVTVSSFKYISCHQQTSVLQLPKEYSPYSIFDIPIGKIPLYNMHGVDLPSIQKLLNENIHFRPYLRAFIQACTSVVGESSIWRLLNTDTPLYTDKKMLTWKASISNPKETNCSKSTGTFPAIIQVVESSSDVPECLEEENLPGNECSKATQESLLKSESSNNEKSNGIVSNECNTGPNSPNKMSPCSLKEASKSSGSLKQTCSDCKKLNIEVADVSPLRNSQNILSETVSLKSESSDLSEEEILPSQKAPSNLKTPISDGSHQDIIPESPESCASAETIYLSSSQRGSLQDIQHQNTPRKEGKLTVEAKTLSSDADESVSSDLFIVFPKEEASTSKKRECEGEPSSSLDSNLNVHLNIGNIEDCNSISEPFINHVTLVEVIAPSLEELVSASTDLIRGFCGGSCLGLTPYSDILWHEENHVVRPFCPGCAKNGQMELLMINFWFKLLLKDAKGKTYDTTFSREYAAEFLGCSLNKFLGDESIRKLMIKALKRLIDSQYAFDITMIKVENCGGIHYRAR